MLLGAVSLFVEASRCCVSVFLELLDPNRMFWCRSYDFKAPLSVISCLLVKIEVEGSCLEPVSLEASPHDRFEAHLDLLWLLFCHYRHLETSPVKLLSRSATPTHFPAVLTMYLPVFPLFGQYRPIHPYGPILVGWPDSQSVYIYFDRFLVHLCISSRLDLLFLGFF